MGAIWVSADSVTDRNSSLEFAIYNMPTKEIAENEDGGDIAILDIDVMGQVFVVGRVSRQPKARE